jgi:hypothetical protein
MNMKSILCGQGRGGGCNKVWKIDEKILKFQVKNPGWTLKI